MQAGLSISSCMTSVTIAATAIKSATLMLTVATKATQIVQAVDENTVEHKNQAVIEETTTKIS